MLPIIAEVRAVVEGHVAALPVAYRTTAEETTFQALRDGGKRAFPIALDPFTVTRFEMADFAQQARDLGVNYIGICCGAAPHHVRAMAEALGRNAPASRYSADLSLHPAIGTEVANSEKPFLADWKD
jgi:betaine-homocysteine S-methyltransferase